MHNKSRLLLCILGVKLSLGSHSVTIPRLGVGLAKQSLIERFFGKVSCSDILRSVPLVETVIGSRRLS